MDSALDVFTYLLRQAFNVSTGTGLDAAEFFQMRVCAGKPSIHLWNPDVGAGTGSRTSYSSRPARVTLALRKETQMNQRPSTHDRDRQLPRPSKNHIRAHRAATDRTHPPREHQQQPLNAPALPGPAAPSSRPSGASTASWARSLAAPARDTGAPRGD
ncbi:hypothetical protein FA95DRAFT_1148868 [Auriscalpium vulgare]|uniref:Uncharacterized protein n=1 Tax=Auriscalpium vulgare TaxID=40419 RepID=A0ACB8R400_9AGAM|nr:hypothetical protein FA95DRAFT_1148868 [Auriscalpium vulgare]